MRMPLRNTFLLLEGMTWYSALLEKLTVTQVLKKFPAFVEPEGL